MTLEEIRGLAEKCDGADCSLPIHLGDCAWCQERSELAALLVRAVEALATMCDFADSVMVETSACAGYDIDTDLASARSLLRELGVEA